MRTNTLSGIRALGLLCIGVLLLAGCATRSISNSGYHADPDRGYAQRNSPFYKGELSEFDVLGIDPKWGVAGLTASAGIAGWIEYLLLRHSMNSRIGRTGARAVYLFKLWGAAAVAAVIGFGLKLILPPMHAIPLAILVLGLYGVLYFVFGAVLGITEARQILTKIVDRIYKIFRINM